MVYSKCCGGTFKKSDERSRTLARNGGEIQRIRMIWNEVTIRERLSKDDRWVCHALKILFDRQTLEERESGYASKRNGIGFNSSDAFFFSRLAEFYIEKGFLTRGQVAAARKGGIARYWKQVLEVIKANERIKEERIRNDKVDCR